MALKQSYKIKVVIFASMRRALFFLLFFSLMILGVAKAQDADTQVLLTGIVLSGDPLVPVPNTNIIVTNKNKGTSSDKDGLFSFYTEANDTIHFSAIGFKGADYIVPNNMDQDHYSIVQIMTNDTVWLQETIIFPWIDYKSFGEELITMDAPISDEERAQMNLDNAQLYERAQATYMDGKSNYKYASKNYNDRMIYSGQVPPMQIFDPFAWRRFIKSIKNGDYKK